MEPLPFIKSFSDSSLTGEEKKSVVKSLSDLGESYFHGKGEELKKSTSSRKIQGKQKEMQEESKSSKRPISCREPFPKSTISWEMTTSSQAVPLKIKDVKQPKKYEDLKVHSNTLNKKRDNPSIPHHTLSHRPHLDKIFIETAFPKDPSITKELHFVESIRYLDREKASDRFNKVEEKKILEILHQEKLLVFREASLGYKVVMSTEAFINALREGFEKSRFQNKKMDYLLAFKDWLGCASFYIADFKNPLVLKAIDAFFESAQSQFGSDFFKKNIKFVEKMKGQSFRENPHTHKLKYSSFNEFLKLYGDNLKGLSEELFQLSVELQRRIKGDFFEKIEGKAARQLISIINNNLINSIVEDILPKSLITVDVDSPYFLKSYQISPSERAKALAKFEFYIKLSKISQKLGDLFTCTALFGVFINERIRTFFYEEPEIKKWDSDVEGLIFFAASKGGVGLRNALLEDKKVPINFMDLLAKYEGLRECFPPIEVGEEDNKQEFINIEHVVAISQLVSDILERQKETADQVSKTNIFDILYFFDVF